MLNPTWIDVDFSGYILAIFLIILVGYIVSGLRLAIFVYLDVKRRDISGWLKWSILALFLNGLGVKLYSMFTKRPETTLSFSTSGIIFGDKTGKWSKFLTSTYGYLYLVLAAISLSILINIIGKDGLVSFLGNGENGFDFLSGLIFATLLAVYFFLGKKNLNKINPLDKPIFGSVKVTDQGVVDESWSKHKKWVIILSTLIISGILIFAGMIIYGFIRYSANI